MTVVRQFQFGLNKEMEHHHTQDGEQVALPAYADISSGEVFCRGCAPDRFDVDTLEPLQESHGN